jgi:hypothetical protein
MKIYCVTIHGRTLESRNIKELLARAVTAKRNMDCKYRPQNQMQVQAPGENSKSCFASA